MTAQTITPKNWVTDLGDLYTPEQEANLNQIISAYEKKTSIEIGILTVETLNGESIEEFTNEQFNKILNINIAPNTNINSSKLNPLFLIFIFSPYK